MAHPSEEGDYVTLHSAKIWYDPHQDQIHLTVNDKDLNNLFGKDGMRVVFNDFPDSANYHPTNYNRCRAVLLAHNKPAPPKDAVVQSRRLISRLLRRKAA